MRYAYIDFFPWDKEILINQLEAEGKHVYSVCDTGGISFIIGNYFVNRYAYMVTDEVIEDAISDKEFFAMSPVEDETLKEISKNLDAEIEAAKKRYEAKKEEEDKFFKELIHKQNIARKLELKYPLFNKRGRRKIPYYNEDKMLVLQCISVIEVEDCEMEIVYFIRNALSGKIIKDSDRIVVNRGCRTVEWLNAIEKKENLSGRRYGYSI